MLIKKITDVNGLMATTVLNTKTSEVKKKIKVVSDLFRKID